jgi:5-hydroxyisourate hydrolase
VISTHVLDTALGRPAPGVVVALHRREEGRGWFGVATAATDGDGRVRELLPPGVMLESGTYRLTFETALYFSEMGLASFYPEVTIVFEVHDAMQHYHVPLLLSPFGYTTYRGS